MTPRDLSTRAALIAGTNAIENMDVSEYLSLRGWALIQAQSVAQALDVIAQTRRTIDLAIVFRSDAGPGVSEFVRTCVSRDIRLIFVNGTRKTLIAGKVVMLDRPFVDHDLDAAFAALGLVEA
jgi:hypothetical protein